jgi:hypothetical protein
MRKLLTSLAGFLLVMIPLAALAQVTTTTTSTVVPSILDLLNQGKASIALFESGAVLAGIAAAVHLLVNLTKIKPLNDYIKRKKLKWLRPLGALLLGFIGGLSESLASGQSWKTATVMAFLGIGSGGMSVVFHEFVASVRGERT